MWVLMAQSSLSIVNGTLSYSYFEIRKHIRNYIDSLKVKYLGFSAQDLINAKLSNNKNTIFIWNAS